MNTTRKITQGAIIAAAYAALCLAAAPISYGPVQFRIAEALCILPYFTPVAIPGLFVGCVIANIIGGFGIYDIIFGSLATLLAAYFSYRLKSHKWLVPLPAVVFNALIVGMMLSLIYAQDTLLYCIVYVGLGQAGACYLLGMPLMLVLEKHKELFR